MNITARTPVFAVLGDPVAHSLSPRMQNAAFRAAGIDAVYVALRVAADEVPTTMRVLTANGGGGNVTIPFKAIAAESATHRSARVAALGVANVFGARNGEVATDNTDVDGIRAALERIEAPATAWRLIGNGGSARAVAGLALESNVALSVAARSAERQAAFLAWFTAAGGRIAPADECEVVINATSLGLGDTDALPWDPHAPGRARWALDLVYRADRPTPWIAACTAAGLRAIDGREVLLQQGAASWRVWFGEKSPPVAVMRAALDGHLG